MLVFATSGKGGAGKSVTTSNVAYQSALIGNDVCYLDFDFGQPAAGSIFDVGGIPEGGLHSYLLGDVSRPQRVDVFATSERAGVRDRPGQAGRLVLMPGDSVGEFPTSSDVIRRCVDLFQQLTAEFEIVFVDLSAGLSYALQMVLAATQQMNGVIARWLVCHRWTKQHVIAAAALVHGRHGILDAGEEIGHDRENLLASLRFVRTALVDPARPGLTSQQSVWITEWDRKLQAIAQAEGAGPLWLLDSVPLDPVLQWREQLITAHDVNIIGIANERTAEAYKRLADLLFDDKAWAMR